MVDSDRPSSTPKEQDSGGADKSAIDNSKQDTSVASQTAWFSSQIEYGRKLILNTIIVAAVLLGISVIAKGTLKRNVVFQPIGVPKELVDRGFTGEAVARHIADELTILWDTAETSKRLGVVGTSGLESVTPKIEVPGTGISIDTIVYYLRDLLGRVDTKISGEITIDGYKPEEVGETNNPTSSPKFNLRLRIVDKGFVYLEPKPTDDLRVLFKRAALPLMEQISPYIAGLTYLQQKDFILATRMAEIQLRTGAVEDQQWAYNLLGSIAQDQNRTSIAKNEFKNLSERFPGFPLSQYNLGSILFKDAAYQESIRASLKGARLDWDDQRRAIGYSNACSALNEMRKKSIKFDHLNKNASEILWSIRKNIKNDQAVVSIQSGGIPDADLTIALCRAAIEADPTYGTAYRIWGGVERDRMNFIEATGLFEKSIAAKPKEPFGYRDMGGLYTSERDWDNAAAFFRKAVSINPDSYSYHHNLGRSLGESDKYEEAIDEFRTALKINPKYAWSHLRWAQTLARKANTQQKDAATSTRASAAEHLNTALKLLPDDQALISNIAETYERLGMIGEAAAVYGKTKEQN